MPITISGDGGITGLELSDFGDVTGTPTDNQALTWDAATSQWVPETILDTVNAAIGSNVVQTIKADTFSSSSAGIFDITGFSVTITPTSATSKVLVLVSATLSENTAESNVHGITIADGSNNNLIEPTSPGNRSAAIAMQFVPVTTSHQVQMSFSLLHSPATTSPFTYKVRAASTGGTYYLNRGGYDADASTVYRAVSTLTAIEVAA